MNKTRKAFSTPELLITIVIFSFGLLPLIVLFQSSNKQTAQAKNLMVAHSLGRTIIAEIRSIGFDLLENEIKT
ncbi:type II secretion system protein, partial [bacterium]|nr:type II secretion system protein [bacterium]